MWPAAVWRLPATVVSSIHHQECKLVLQKVIKEKAPTKAFSWLKVATNGF